MTVYIVFRYLSDEPKDYEFMGVFSSKEKAEAVCADWTYVVAPANLDEEWPLESIEWPGAYWPHPRHDGDHFPVPAKDG